MGRPAAESSVVFAPVERELLDASPAVVAPRLVHLLLVRSTAEGIRVGRIVEVEAYGGADDEASHAARGPSERNATMFGPAGHLYVYLSYGIHSCANVSCGPDGVGGAVLLRALEPVDGVEIMRGARPGRGDLELCSGPGKLCAALGIDRSLDGVDLCAEDSPVLLASDGTPPPRRLRRSARIGISRAIDRQWRWFTDSSHVSAPRSGGASVPARARPGRSSGPVRPSPARPSPARPSPARPAP